jgi:hypothetical protein
VVGNINNGRKHLCCRGKGKEYQEYRSEERRQQYQSWKKDTKKQMTDIYEPKN